MDDKLRKFIEVKEELDEIAGDRKELAKVLKDVEMEVTKYLDKETDGKSEMVDGYKIYLKEITVRKNVNFELLEQLITAYFKGNSTKGREIAEYIWTHRPTDTKKQIKITKPRKSNKN